MFIGVYLIDAVDNNRRLFSVKRNTIGRCASHSSKWHFNYITSHADILLACHVGGGCLDFYFLVQIALPLRRILSQKEQNSTPKLNFLRAVASQNNAAKANP